MAMASSSSISLVLFILTFFSESHLSLPLPNPKLNIHRPIASLNSIPEIHDLLPNYNLPKGLLPNNVKSYTLSQDDGVFEVELESPCYVQFDQLVYYDKKIKGKLSVGSVSDVSGIQAKKLFFWVSVTGIKVVAGGDMIEFDVGALSERLPAKQFEDIPVCKAKAIQETRPESM